MMSRGVVFLTSLLPVGSLADLAVSHVEEAKGVVIGPITSALKSRENVVGEVLGKLTEGSMVPPNPFVDRFGNLEKFASVAGIAPTEAHLEEGPCNPTGVRSNVVSVRSKGEGGDPHIANESLEENVGFSRRSVGRRSDSEGAGGGQKLVYLLEFLLPNFYIDELAGVAYHVHEVCVARMGDTSQEFVEGGNALILNVKVGSHSPVISHSKVARLGVVPEHAALVEKLGGILNKFCGLLLQLRVGVQDSGVDAVGHRVLEHPDVKVSVL